LTYTKHHKPWGIFSFIIWAHFLLWIYPFPWDPYESFELQAKQAVAAEEALMIAPEERTTYEEWRVGIRDSTWAYWIIWSLYGFLGLLSSLLLYLNHRWWPNFLVLVSFVAVLDLSLEMFDYQIFATVMRLSPGWLVEMDVGRLYVNLHLAYIWRIGFILLFFVSAKEIFDRFRQRNNVA
jgi:hypothetical protein